MDFLQTLAEYHRLGIADQIDEEEVTGMTDIPNTGNKSADDVWYTLDGRCLNGKPARKGLYIHQGRKTVIK